MRVVLDIDVVKRAFALVKDASVHRTTRGILLRMASDNGIEDLDLSDALGYARSISNFDTERPASLIYKLPADADKEKGTILHDRARELAQLVIKWALEDTAVS